MGFLATLAYFLYALFLDSTPFFTLLKPQKFPRCARTPSLRSGSQQPGGNCKTLAGARGVVAELTVLCAAEADQPLSGALGGGGQQLWAEDEGCEGSI